jgi:hypothetical protein
MSLADAIPTALDGQCDKSGTPFHLRVGKSADGAWIVQDQQGRCGGVFASRAEAFRFACRERGDRAGAVVLHPGTLELFEAPQSN